MSDNQSQLKTSIPQNNDIFNGNESTLMEQSEMRDLNQAEQRETIIKYISTTSRQRESYDKESKQATKQIEKQEQLYTEDFIIPLSHTKRQKSLSPIKNQHSIASEQHFTIGGPKINLASMPKVQIIQQKSIKSQARSSAAYLLIKNEANNYESAIQVSKVQPLQRSIQSSRRSHSRRTQIFSSDKKRADKPTNLNKNHFAEQMLNQNKQQRDINTKPFALQKNAYRSNFYTNSPIQQKSKVQSFVLLSQNKSKQIQKLEDIYSSPQKASHQYWQSIYPQSKKYIASLNSVLSEEKKVILNWQSELQTTLRQNLYEVQQILLQKLYEICRLSVKRWVQQQIEALQVFYTEHFSCFTEMNRKIEQKQMELSSVQKVLQNLQNLSQNQTERSKLYKLMERTVLSPEYTEEVSQTSVKVKELISQSEQIALNFCKQKLQKANNLESFQYNHEEYRMDKKSYQFLKILFHKQRQIKAPAKKSSKNIMIPDMNIGHKIQKVLQKSEVRNVETARQVNVNEFSQYKFRQPISHRKHNTGGFKIKDNQKEYEQFQNEFDKRKKNFMGNNFSLYADEKRSQQRPISLKIDENISFEKKLSTLLKKINDQNQNQIQDPNRSSIDTNSYNEYNDLLKKKKLKNRQNFFRYSMQ